MEPRSECFFADLHGDQITSSKKSLVIYKTLWHGQSGAILRSTVDHHVLPVLTFNMKRARAWNISAHNNLLENVEVCFLEFEA